MQQLFPIAAIVQILAAAVHEPQMLSALLTARPQILLLIFTTGVLGFSVVFTQYKVVGCASALVHTLSGQAKTAATIIGSALVFGTSTSWQQLGGASLAMSGLVLYANCSVSHTEWSERKDQEFSKNEI